MQFLDAGLQSCSMYSLSRGTEDCVFFGASRCVARTCQSRCLHVANLYSTHSSGRT